MDASFWYLKDLTHHPRLTYTTPNNRALAARQVRGLTRSGELSRMLPSEMALLAHGWPRKVRYGVCSWLYVSVAWKGVGKAGID